MTELEQIYREDLKECNLIQEVGIWQTRWSNTDSKPKTVLNNLKVSDSNLYPSLYIIFTIFCILPLTTCEWY